MRGLVVFRFDPRNKKVNPVATFVKSVFIPLVRSYSFSDTVLLRAAEVRAAEVRVAEVRAAEVRAAEVRAAFGG